MCVVYANSHLLSGMFTSVYTLENYPCHYSESEYVDINVPGSDTNTNILLMISRNHLFIFLTKTYSHKLYYWNTINTSATNIEDINKNVT